MPSDLQLKVANAVHQGLLKLRVREIRVGPREHARRRAHHHGAQERSEASVMLTSPLQEGDTIVVVASRGGDDTHPAWFLNLRDNPAVEVSSRAKPKQPMQAHVGDARGAGSHVAAGHVEVQGLRNYQTKTTREIPLVLLEPA